MNSLLNCEASECKSPGAGSLIDGEIGEEPEWPQPSAQGQRRANPVWRSRWWHWDENVGPKSQGGEIIVPISQAKDILVDDGHTASEN